MSNVQLCRLHSGEEVLANFEGPATTPEGVSCYEVSSPALLLLVNEKGEQEVNLFPWMPYCDTKSMMIPVASVLFMVRPHPALVNRYNVVFGSGIVVPPPGLSVSEGQMGRNPSVSEGQLRLVTE